MKRIPNLAAILAASLAAMVVCAAGRPSFSPDTWDDLRLPLEGVGFVPGGSPPDYEVFRGNVRAYAFATGADEEVFFSFQLPHRWKFGSEIRPHVHIGWPAAPVNGETVTFDLECTVQSMMAGVFGAPTTTTATYTINTANAYDAQYGHTLLSLPAISMTGHTASAMALCRLYRDVSEDNYGQDVSVLEFDAHFQSDSLGTVQEFTVKP